MQKAIALDVGQLLGIRQLVNVAVEGTHACELGRLLNKVGIDEESDNSRGPELARLLSKVGGAEEDT
jgi:hypothetical protein